MGVADSLRESWATRVGFILAAVGSAVGLGNIWRFPFQVGQEGGAAFLLIYLLFVLLIGLPAMLVEFTVGRRTRRNTVGALRDIGGNSWKYVGGIFILIGFVILSYYSVVAGWVIRYFVGSFTGAYFADPEGYFVSISVGLDALAFHALFMAAVIVIVGFGIRRGIELAVKIMVPAIVVLILLLAIYAATLPNVGAAYAYYLSPDISVIASEWQSIIPAAAGQAFFTLSLGMGVMITYASYISEKENLAEDSGVIIALDTGIAFLVGLLVFPILFAAGIGPADPGPGAIFVALAGALAEISFGQIIGILFFGTFAIAALSSAISLMEVVVSYAIDEHGIDRWKAAAGIGAGMFLLGAPVTTDLILIDLYDQLAAEILLVTGAILLMILVGWVISDVAIDELQTGIRNIYGLDTVWIWLVRIPVLLVLVTVLILALQGYATFLQEEFIPWVSG